MARLIRTKLMKVVISGMGLVSVEGRRKRLEYFSLYSFPP